MIEVDGVAKGDGTTVAVDLVSSSIDVTPRTRRHRYLYGWSMADEVALRARLRRALTDAMRQRDRTAVTALRTALAAIDNSEAVDRPPPPADEGPGPIAGGVHGVGRSEALRRDLTPAEVLDIVVDQIDETDHAANEYERMGQLDRANLLRKGAAVLRSHVAH